MTSILYCEYCNWKKILRNEENEKNFKCESCGRLIKNKKISDPQKELEKELKKEQEKKELENWIKKTLEYREKFENE